MTKGTKDRKHTIAGGIAGRTRDLSWTIPLPGETIAGKYVVEGVCGRGGLAAVLSAIHLGLDQRVAIKLLLPEWAGEEKVVERFLREGRAATRIRSEHVVRVFDVGTLESGAPFLVLEYLEGHNLDDVVAMWGPLPVVTAVDWLLQAAEAIAEAHSYGIVHRDLKPANLFLTRRADGSACIKVIDFGLSKLTDPNMCDGNAKLTRANDVLGSPHYMAPEQLRATRDADTPADLWSLGAVLHELLTGQTPFRGETIPELCATVLTQPPPPIGSLRGGIPVGVEAAVLRCLQKDPAARYASVAELARALVPFGTAIARESCARIERVLDGSQRTSDLSSPSLPSTQSEPPWGETPAEEWPSDMDVIPRHGQASARVVFGSLVMLAGLGAGVFMWLYSTVHAEDPPYPGVTMMQPAVSATTSASQPPPTQSSPPSQSTVSAPTRPQEPPGPSAQISRPQPAARTPPAAKYNHAAAPPPPRVKPAPSPASAPSPAPSPASAPSPAPSPASAPSPAPSPGPSPLPASAAPSSAPQHDDAPPASSAPSADDVFDGRK